MMDHSVANFRDERHSLADVLMNSSAPKYILLVFLLLCCDKINAVSTIRHPSIKFTRRSSFCDSSPHADLPMAPDFSRLGDGHLLRIHPALQVESLKYALEGRKHGGEGAVGTGQSSELLIRFCGPQEATERRPAGM